MFNVLGDLFCESKCTRPPIWLVKEICYTAMTHPCNCHINSNQSIQLLGQTAIKLLWLSHLTLSIHLNSSSTCDLTEDKSLECELSQIVEAFCKAIGELGRKWPMVHHNILILYCIGVLWVNFSMLLYWVWYVYVIFKVWWPDFLSACEK